MFLSKEVWKDIPGSNGMYQISSFGKVRSTDRWIIRVDGKKRLLKGKVLKLSENNMGYYRVPIRIDGEKKRVFVHRLVASVFIPNPNGFDIVNHKDFDPHNNRVSNLEWTTIKGNVQYSLAAGRFERTPIWLNRLKNSLDDVLAKPIVGERLSDGKKLYYKVLNDCAKDGFQPSCVSCCCNGKRQTHKGYIWRFER